MDDQTNDRDDVEARIIRKATDSLKSHIQAYQQGDFSLTFGFNKSTGDIHLLLDENARLREAVPIHFFALAAHLVTKSALLTPGMSFQELEENFERLAWQVQKKAAEELNLENI